jgi:hypothetical protein
MLHRRWGGAEMMRPTRRIKELTTGSFSSAWKKTNQKKTPVSSFLLRVVASDGTHGNSLRSDSLCAFPVPRADARRWTTG